MRFPSPIRFLADRRGNVAMMYALMLPVLLFGAGFAGRLHPRHAGADQARRRGRRGGARRADAGDDGADRRDGADGGDEPVHRDGQRPNLADRRRHGRHRHGAADRLQRRDSATSRSATPPPTKTSSPAFSAIRRSDRRQSTANASIAPNIDFYLLLDNSPSMALPATRPGSTDAVADHAAATGGCAFACHQGSTDRLFEPEQLEPDLQRGPTRATITNRNCSSKNNDIVGDLCLDGSRPTLAADMISSGHVFCKTSIGRWTTMRSLSTRTSHCASTRSTDGVTT